MLKFKALILLFKITLSSIIWEIRFSSFSNITNGGYTLDGDFTYELDNRNPLNFRLIYNKKAGYSSKIRPLIKIKS